MCVCVCVWVREVCLVAGHVNARAAVMIVVFSLFGLTCIGVMSFGWFKHLLPQLRLKMGKVSL